jgi:hypothetical protein
MFRIGFLLSLVTNEVNDSANQSTTLTVLLACTSPPSMDVTASTSPTTTISKAVLLLHASVQ